MAKTVRKTVKLPRNYIAVAAHTRHAATMKHRNEPRGGTRNDMTDMIEGMDEEYGDDHQGHIDLVGLELYHKENEPGSLEEKLKDLTSDLLWEVYLTVKQHEQTLDLLVKQVILQEFMPAIQEAHEQAHNLMLQIDDFGRLKFGWQR